MTIIIHNAWRLHFKLPLSGFEPHIAATRNLIELARSIPRVRFILVSSVNSALPYGEAHGVMPERNLFDACSAVGNGYGESKFVAEKIVAASGLDAASVRVGQISGSQSGTWPTSQWVPMMIKSCVSMGIMPASSRSVGWTPPEVAAGALVDLALSRKPLPEMANIVNPKEGDWTAILQSSMDTLSRAGIDTARRVRFVPFAEWCAELGRYKVMLKSKEEIAHVPAVRIMSCFELCRPQTNWFADGLPAVETKVMQTYSRILRESEAVGPADAERWCKYWVRHGFFDGNRGPSHLMSSRL